MKRNSRELRRLAGVDKPVEKTRPIHLDMTDAQIDEKYFYLSKMRRNELKREAAQERLRQAVALEIQKEIGAWQSNLLVVI